MDGGYSSRDIRDFTYDHMDAVSVIDFKADRNGVKEEMDPAEKERYKARTTVERTNSELKDSFLAPKLFCCVIHRKGFSVDPEPVDGAYAYENFNFRSVVLPKIFQRGYVFLFLLFCGYATAIEGEASKGMA